MTYTKHCTYCNKVANESSHEIINDKRIIHLTCGHTELEFNLSFTGDHVEFLDGRRFPELDGKFTYQFENFKVGLNSGWKLANWDEMGLGKTLVGIAPIHVYGNEFLPAIIFCKAGLKHQWFKEIVTATGRVPQILSSGDKPIFDFFDIFICSIDSAESQWKNFENTKLKYIIIDEIHLIKNTESKRTQAIFKYCESNPSAYQYQAGGTPIKNNALEVYAGLHILRPEIFRSKQGFMNRYVDNWFDGYKYKIGGFKDPAAFWSVVKEFVVRHERKDVASYLPKIFRSHRYVTNDNKKLSEAYQKAEKDFLDYYDEIGGQATTFEEYSNSLAKISKLRHLAGLAMIPHVVDFITEFLITSSDKIVIFYRHIDVGAAINEILSEYCRDGGFKPPLDLRPVSDIGESEHWRLQEIFKNDEESRILLASTLASGEGLNLQVCGHAVIAEREWNPANEEQAEARFPRPGTKFDKVNITYMILLDSIYEYFTEIVERKRKIKDEAMRGEVSNVDWNETSLMKELMAEVSARGRKRLFKP